MPFIKDGRILIEKAFAEHYAMPSFNVCSLEMAKACIEAAEKERAPIMLQTGPDDLKHGSPFVMASMIKALAEEADVPIMLHLDHGDSEARVAQCVRAGYSSVMFDGEHYTLVENVARTKSLAQIVHASGAALEAAAGSFGAGEGSSHDEVHLTDPEVAEALVTDGEADMVACSVGSMHGQSSHIDLKRLRNIAKAINKPIVFHGGSGIPKEDIAKAVKLGVVKLNIGAALIRASLKAFNTTTPKTKWHYEIYKTVHDECVAAARDKIRTAKASKKAN
jgi:fructose-bisphosphate aldolase, class II